MGEPGKINLSCKKVDISVPGRSLVRQLDVAIAGGEFLALLGPNGVGKSLSLHALAGLRPPDNGQIELNGQQISALARQQVAERLALLPQYTEGRVSGDGDRHRHDRPTSTYRQV